MGLCLELNLLYPSISNSLSWGILWIKKIDSTTHYWMMTSRYLSYQLTVQYVSTFILFKNKKSNERMMFIVFDQIKKWVKIKTSLIKSKVKICCLIHLKIYFYCLKYLYHFYTLWWVSITIQILHFINYTNLLDFKF